MNKGPDASRTISKIYEQRLAIYGHKTKHVSGNINLKFTLTWAWLVVLLCVPQAVIIVSNLFILKSL